jgi:hypothetical protein
MRPLITVRLVLLVKETTGAHHLFVEHFKQRLIVKRSSNPLGESLFGITVLKLKL